MDPRDDFGVVTTAFPPIFVPGFPPDATLFAHDLRLLSHLLKQASTKTF